MAPSSLGKKSKKAEPKAATETKTVASSAESSSKTSKTLKRKKDAEAEAPVAEDADLPKSSKKAKKDEASLSKLSKSIKVPKDVAKVVETLVEATVPGKTAEKKKNKAVSETTAEPSTKPPVVEEEEKTKKTKAKSEDSPMAAAAEPSVPVSILKKPKSVLKPSKSTEPIPTFISRPRKAEATPKTKSKKSKAKSPEPVEEDEDEEDAEDAAQSDDDEEGHLHGFSTDDDDSSDEEDAMDVEPSQFDLGKLPTIAKDHATVARKLEKAKQHPGEDRGVLSLSRLPHGFYEDQLRAYFSQFGNVTRLRISRNKKTGKSKHYGFIEFDSSAVAQIVADTMDNYLLMGHIMRCKVIPKDQVHPELWVGANRKWRVVPRDRVARVEHNKPRTPAEQGKAANRLLKRQKERKAKLAKAGIEYDFDAAAYKKPTTTPAQT